LGINQFAESIRKEAHMTIDRLIMTFAGSFILISLLLSQIHSPYWLWFTAFVGANLMQASFTGFCPMAIVLKKLGVKTGMAFE
jgi:Inner membrane protein YgaP-like, transmembrane domain